MTVTDVARIVGWLAVLGIAFLAAGALLGTATTQVRRSLGG